MTKLLPGRHTLDPFPHSQHCLLLITVPSLIQVKVGKSTCRRNFCKAKWQDFELKSTKKLTVFPRPLPTTLMKPTWHAANSCSVLPKGASHVAAETATPHAAGMKSVTRSCINTVRPLPMLRELRPPPTFLRDSTPSAESGGLRWWSQSTSPTLADKLDTQSTS